jgi:phenylalanyl-tRNA synthetase beta chain
MLTEKQKRARRTRRLLASRGFVEAVTWSFIPDQATHFGGGAPALDLANPSRRKCLRCGRVCYPATAVTRNRNRGTADVALFRQPSLPATSPKINI